MSLRHPLEHGLQLIADQLFAVWPQPLPPAECFARCKIVSHRGEHDNCVVRENTCAAFDLADQAGVWGLELDVRWTQDRQPVVIHDRDCRRVFGLDIAVEEVSLEELRVRVPEIPTLASVIERYGGRRHLMIELKRTPRYRAEQFRARLRDSLEGLQPEQDYHLLSLKPALFDAIDFVPKTALIPVSMRNTRQISRIAAAADYGGVAGHYVLLTEYLLQRHRTQGQAVGTGFIASRNCLYRELNRGVEWIFSNHAVALQQIVDTFCEATKS